MNNKVKKMLPSLSAPIVRSSTASGLNNAEGQIQPSQAWICIIPPCTPFAGDDVQ